MNDPTEPQDLRRSQRGPLFPGRDNRLSEGPVAVEQEVAPAIF